MNLIKATCQTEGCQQKGITHEFKSPVTNTVCGVCSLEVTDLVIEEVTDGTNEEAEQPNRFTCSTCSRLSGNQSRHSGSCRP